MFSGEIRRLIFQVIGSWQVLAVTGVLIVYVFLVNYVARLYHHRPPRVRVPKAKPAAPGAPPPAAAPAPAPPKTDELGLEEAPTEE